MKLLSAALYVSNEASISSTTDAVLSTMNLGVGPWAIAYDPANNEVFVANSGGSTVSIIGATSFSPVSTLTLGTVNTGGGQAATYSATGDVWEAAYNTGTVYVINTATNLVVNTITGFVNPSEIAFSPSNNVMYVGDNGNNTISELNASNGQIIGTPINASFSGTNAWMAYDPSSNELWATGFRVNISVVNAATNTLTVLTGFNGTEGVNFDPANGYMYVTSYNNGTVSVLNAVTHAVVGIINTGGNPFYVAYDAANHDMQVSLPAQNSMAVINSKTNTVVEYVSVPGLHGDIAFDPLDGDLYLSNFYTVTVYDGGSNLVATINVYDGFTLAFGGTSIYVGSGGLSNIHRNRKLK